MIDPLCALDSLPRVHVAGPDVRRLAAGQAVEVPTPDAREVAVLDDRGRLVAIGRPLPGGAGIRPTRVFIRN